MKSVRLLVQLAVGVAVVGLATGLVLSQTPTTVNLLSISIAPANLTIGLGSHTAVAANGSFDDGSVQDLSEGRWDVLFSPQLDVSVCQPGVAGVHVFSGQAANQLADGTFHNTWGDTQNVTAVGKINGTTFSATMTCVAGGASVGSISATWTGTEYDGSFAGAGNSGSVIIRGTTWTSSNPAVATIDATGGITAVGLGTTTLTATYGAVCEKIGAEPPTPVWGCQGVRSATTSLTVGHPDDNNDSAAIRSGYAIITPVSGAPATGLLAFATFGLKRSDGDTAQAGVLPALMTTDGFVTVDTNTQLSRDLGIAFANPGSSTVNLTLTLRKGDGTLVSTKQETFNARQQGALFVSQIFSDQSAVLANFSGSLEATSDNPIAMVGLKFRGTEFSTVLITSLSPAIAVPSVSTGIGGSGAVILPHFAEDGGWSTQFVIANPGTSSMVARLDLFDPTGKPMQITLNGNTQSSFNVTVAANGTVTLAPQDATGQSRF